jgi:hypothetical protein
MLVNAVKGKCFFQEGKTGSDGSLLILVSFRDDSFVFTEVH